MALVGFHAATFDVVPQTYGGVECPGEDIFAIGREADGGYGGVVFVDERAEALAGGGVPDAAMFVSQRLMGWLGGLGSLHEAITGTTDNQRPVTDEVDASNGVRMRRERAHHPRDSHIPEEDGFVVGAADEHVAFGRECEGVDVIVVAEERDGVCFTLLESTSAAFSTSKTHAHRRDIPEPNGLVVGA